LKREAEERERQALLDAKAAEQARLDAERARLAAEPTFTIASVPVNKLRPFYFFAAGYQPIKRFLAKEEKIDLHLMSHGRRLSTAQIPLSHFFASMQERRELTVYFHTEGLSDTFVRMTLGLSRIEDVSHTHFPLQHHNSGIWMCQDIDFSPSEPLPHGWLAGLSDAGQLLGKVSPEERLLTHQIAKEELVSKQNAEIALQGLLLEQQAADESSSDSLLKLDAPPGHGAGQTSSHSPGSSPRSIMEQFGGGTKGREKELRDYQKRQQFTHIPKQFGSSKAQLEKKADAAFAKHQKEALETDKPAYWRCVIEMLHIAGLGPRKRGSMYAANGAQVAVEFRLFGQTLRTGFVPASPPVTLMDSHHQMYVRARQSALRRYFFASPRIFVAIMYSHEDALTQSRAAISRTASEMSEEGDDGEGGEHEEEVEDQRGRPASAQRSRDADETRSDDGESLRAVFVPTALNSQNGGAQLGSFRPFKLAKGCSIFRSC
jgi:hypothetical protein